MMNAAQVGTAFMNFLETLNDVDTDEICMWAEPLSRGEIQAYLYRRIMTERTRSNG